MRSSPTEDEVRDEIDAVLRSGIFARAPNLESFFRYVCERYARGEGEQLKQYSIAVEALGRPADFDQKKDSIVRVEANRLRKRLSEFYENSGATHRIHICIPQGAYAPQFEFLDAPAANSPDPSVDGGGKMSDREPKVEEVVEAPIVENHWTEKKWMVRRPLAVIASFSVILSLAAFGAIKWRLLTYQNASSEFGNEFWNAAAGSVVPDDFRILAGYHGETFNDIQGREWHADAHYSGGRSIALPRQTLIQGIVGPRCFKSARMGKFHYDVPVRRGIYEIHLYFAETEYGYGNPKGGGDSSRLFRISINGRSVVDLCDVHALAGGPNRLFVKVFKDISPGKDGKIHMAFDPITQMAFLNAMEILPTAAGRIRPIRIVAQEHSVIDADGHVWFADEFVIGGSLVLRRNAVFPESNGALYQGERYGNFTYHLPVAPGKYRLTLHFAETWFGTPSAAISAHEHRLFDVYLNGVVLLRDFDLLRVAGGPNRGIERVFENVEPNAQGELALQFVPTSNYAEINAIEVVNTN